MTGSQTTRRATRPCAALAVLLAALLLADVAGAQAEAEGEGEAGGDETAEELRHDPSDVHVGLLGLDLFALERVPNRTTTRLLDLWLLRLLEVGVGQQPEYTKVGLLESPLFRTFTYRKEGEQGELRLLDLRALALVRSKRFAEDRSEFHLLKLPLLGSLVGYEHAGRTRRWTILYLLRFRTDEPEEVL